MKNRGHKNLILIKIVHYMKDDCPLLALKLLNLIYHNKILGLTISAGDYYFERGLIFYELQKFKEAETSFRKALRSKLKRGSFVHLETINKLLQILIKKKSWKNAFKLLIWTTEIELTSMDHLPYISYFSNTPILRYWNRLAPSRRKKVLNKVARWISAANKFFGSRVIIKDSNNIKAIAMKTKEFLTTLNKMNGLVTIFQTLIDDCEDSLRHVYLGIYHEIETTLTSISIPFYQKLLENMLLQKVVPKLDNYKSVREDIPTEPL